MIKWALQILFLLFLSNTGFGQFPPIRIIDFYGLRRVSEKDVRDILKIKEGDDAIETVKSAEEIRKRLKTLPGVGDASINLVCCDDIYGKSIIFVGIQEKGTTTPGSRPAPTGTVRLPKNIIQAGQEFQAAFMRVMENKDFSEDDSNGHALFNDKGVRAVQEKFVLLAAPNLKILRDVLHNSSDGKQRALAAEIIAYAPDKKAITGDLIFAAGDSEEEVRNNSTRALIIIAKYARANPRLGIRIPADIFVNMLNSPVWTDRNKSIGVLQELTIQRDTVMLAQLKNRALASLAEMARWKSPGHASGAFFILGRMSGFSEEDIRVMWKSDDREAQVKKFLDKIGKT